jgi:hypothetical protein
MKKIVAMLILVFMFLLTSNVYAQFQFGPLLGGNLSGLSIEPDMQGRNINFVTGFTAGAAIVYNFSSMFSIQLEPTYTERGASTSTAQTDVGLILEIEQSIEMNYIDVPVLFKLSFEGDFIKPYLLAGGYAAFPLQDTKVKIDKVIANGQNVITIIPNELLEQELKNESVDYGLNFGAGISFPLGIVDMFIEAQYNLGLTNLNDEVPQEGIEQDVIKNKGLQIQTGLLFTL